MEPYEGFEGYVAAYEAGSITGGARQLGMPRATLSRQLSRLEDRLGVRLVHRDTRRFDPTQAGEDLYERARRIVRESREAIDAVRRNDDVPRGLLRVSTPPASRDGRFERLLVDFARRWPEVRLEVHSTTAHVDLKAERFDVALRGGRVRDPDLIARAIASSCTLVVGSPAYLEARGRPQRVDDLASHQLLAGFDAGTLPQRSWPLLDGGSVDIEPHLAANNLEMLRQAALAGHGLAFLPDLTIADDLAEGRLVPVLADLVGQRSQISLVYPERAYLLPKVRAFVDHVLAARDEVGSWSAPSEVAQTS